MTAFTHLEVAALHSIFSETPELAAELRRQLVIAHVAKRENSGGGFFTFIVVPDEALRVSSPKALGHETQARVTGLENGLGFVLFMEDGRLHMLEGFAWGSESTTSLDLAKLDFEIFKAPVRHLT